MYFWQIIPLFLIAELFTLVAVVDEIGFFKTFLLWVICGSLGLWIVQTQGLGMLMKTREILRRGAVPVDGIFDGLCLVLAGFLFIMPGFLGDIVAIFLLIPDVRRKIRELGIFKATIRTGQPQRPQDDVIDGSYVRVEETVEQIELKSSSDEKSSS